MNSGLFLSTGELCALGVDEPSCPLMRKRTPLALTFRMLDHEPRDEADEDRDAAGPGVAGDRMDDCVAREALDSVLPLVFADRWLKVKYFPGGRGTDSPFAVPSGVSTQFPSQLPVESTCVQR
jgi:hypothetical protein